MEQGLITLIVAYTAFLAGEWLLHVSGVISVLVAGLVMGRRIRGGQNAGFVDRLWSLNAFVANSLVFLLMGVTVTLAMFEERWLAMLIGIGGVLVARAVGIFGLLPLTGPTPGIDAVPLNEQAAIFSGGLRGAVTLALALALPVELDYWWTIQSIAFGLVPFTLAVQAPTMPPLLRNFGLTRRSSGSEA